MFLFLIQVIIISLSGVLAPGPVTASTIALGTKSKHAGFFISLGHSAIELPLLTAIALGIGFIFEYPAAKTSIGLIGGAYLLWMGWQMFKTCLPLQGRDSNGAGSSIVRDSLRSDSVDNGAVSLAVAGTATRPFMTGLVLSATNPYFILWWATVGLNMAKDAASFGFLAVVLFAIVHSLCDMTWLELISFTSYKGTKLLNDTNQKYILIFCAAAIIFFGFYFIIKSFF